MDLQRLNEVSEAFDKLKSIQINYQLKKCLGLLLVSQNVEYAKRKARASATILESLPEMILELYEKNLPPRKDLSVWKTGDGRKIPISELDTDHLKNIVRFLKECHWTKRRDQLPLMIQELRDRGFYA